MGEAWEGRVKERILGGMTNTKGLLKSNMETYYYCTFLK